MNDIFVVPLINSNKICIIDVTEAFRVMQYEWHEHKGYVCCHEIKHKWQDQNHFQSLHRFIFIPNKVQKVDHKNRNPLDNTRRNLRNCTSSQNSYNSKNRSYGTSKYRGVSFHKKAFKWQAHLKVNKKTKYLGIFHSEKAAALAYNKAALEFIGKDFSVLNEVC